MNFIEYVKQIWKNGPSGGTPWSATRLNHMEDGIKANNDMISELNSNISVLRCYGAVQSNNSDKIVFTNIKKIHRVAALLIGNGNSVPTLRCCALFTTLASTGKADDNYISEGTISVTENSNGTVNIEIGDVQRWGNYWLILFG